MWKDILIPGAAAAVVSFIMFLSSKNLEKKTMDLYLTITG